MQKLHEKTKLKKNVTKKITFYEGNTCEIYFFFVNSNCLINFETITKRQDKDTFSKKSKAQSQQKLN
jgi:hypothetical protein